MVNQSDSPTAETRTELSEEQSHGEEMTLTVPDKGPCVTCAGDSKIQKGHMSLRGQAQESNNAHLALERW